MAFGQDKKPASAPSSVSEFRKQFEQDNKPQNTNNYKGTTSNDSDRYARMLMTSYNMFRPLLVATMHSRQDATSDVLFEPVDSNEAQGDQRNEVVRRISIYWNQTIQLIKHMRSTFSQLGTDTGAPENRWMLRILWRQAADLVANAAINNEHVDVEALKQTYSASVMLSTGKEVDGVNDKDLVAYLIDNADSQESLDAFGGNADAYTLGQDEALHLATVDAYMRLSEAVDDYHFFQGVNDPQSKSEITQKLMEIVQESASLMYGTSVGVDEAGGYNVEYTKNITAQTQQQMMMRSISDSATIVEKTYRHYSKRARKSYIGVDDKDEQYRLKLKVFRDGVPYEQIKYDTKQQRVALNVAARPAVKMFSQLLDNTVEDTKKRAETQKSAPQPTTQKSEKEAKNDSEKPTP